MTVLSITETGLLQNPVAKDRGAALAPPGKVDDALGDDFAHSLGAVSQVERLAHAISASKNGVAKSQ
jgi:hypothetical protein